MSAVPTILPNSAAAEPTANDSFLRALASNFFVRVILKALITISSLVILSCAIYYGLGWTKDVFGEGASWLAVVVLIIAYIALVRTRAKHPDLPLDDPTKQLILVPDFYESARTGLHYLLPVVVLIWCLIIEEMSPGLAALCGRERNSAGSRRDGNFNSLHPARDSVRPRSEETKRGRRAAGLRLVRRAFFYVTNWK